MVEPERCQTCHETDRARCTMPSECGCDHPEAIRDAKGLMADIMSGALLAPDKDARIAELEARAEKAEAEVKRLDGLVYVPGLWRCAKCKLTLIQGAIRASDGAVGGRDEPGDRCPNCNVPLWRVTERDAGNDMVDRADEYLARATTAEAEVARLRAAGTFNEGIEAAGAKIENMIFLLPISRAEEGSIASRDEMLDEMVEQASSAIRSLLRPDDGGK